MLITNKWTTANKSGYKNSRRGGNTPPTTETKERAVFIEIC